MRPMLMAVFALLLLFGALSACAADDLDCSLGVIKRTCPPGTIGFDRMVVRLRVVERICRQKGLEPGSDAYASCLAVEGGVKLPRSPAPFYRLGPS